MLRILATSISCVCLMVGVGLAFEIAVPPNSTARSALNSNLSAITVPLNISFASGGANVRDAFVSLATSAAVNISETLAPLSNIPARTHEQLAAVSSLPWVDHAADAVFNFLCPILRNCPRVTAVHIAAQPPSKANSQHATSPQNVKAASQSHSPAPTQGGATATSVAVSSAFPAPRTIIQQPVIERTKETVRTVVEGGVNASTLDARMQALQQSLQAQIAAVGATSHGESQTIYQTLGAVAQIDNVDNIHVTNSHWTGGVISGATITGGSVTATDFAGVLGISKGGTGTSTSPSYGNVLLGDGAGGFNLVATSSLGIVSGGTPGGSDTYVQFNDANSFGGNSAFTFNKTTGLLSLSHASSTQQSIFDRLFVGGTATTTIFGSATPTFGAGLQITALNVTSTSATSTFANGIQLTSGCFRMANGACAGAGGGGGTVTSIDASGGSTGLTFSGGPITGAGTLTLAGTLAVANGGTGWASLTAGAIPTATARALLRQPPQEQPARSSLY